MKTLITISLTVFFTAITAAYFEHKRDLEQAPPKYYDGEGNEIPQHAVELLVKSEFVKLDSAQLGTVAKYFER